LKVQPRSKPGRARLLPSGRPRNWSPFDRPAHALARPLLDAQAVVPAMTDRNRLVCLSKRVVQPVPIPTVHVDPYRESIRFLDAHELPIRKLHKMDTEEWLDSRPWMTRGKREALMAALLVPLRKEHAHIRAFLKFETGLNDPRLICPRSDEYRVRLGPWIAAADEVLRGRQWTVRYMDCHSKEGRVYDVAGLEGANLVQTDFSRFDSTYQRETMLLRNQMIINMFAGDTSELRMLLEMQEELVGRLGRFSFKSHGLASGDPTTSIGNTLINRWVVWRALGPATEMRPWRSIHEGDDGLVFVPPNVDAAGFCRKMVEFAASVGFKLKAEPGGLETVGFCGRWYIVDGDMCVSMADLPRALAKLHVSCANVPHYSERYMRGLLRAKALSMLASDRDTPILSAWVSSVLQLTRHDKACWADREVAYKWGGGVVQPADPRRRSALIKLIAVRMGLSETAILEYEDHIRTVGVWGDLKPLDCFQQSKWIHGDAVHGVGACEELL